MFMNGWIRGPITSRNAIVPTPNGPPNSHPIEKILISIIILALVNDQDHFETIVSTTRSMILIPIPLMMINAEE